MLLRACLGYFCLFISLSIPEGHTYHTHRLMMVNIYIGHYLLGITIAVQHIAHVTYYQLVK